MTARTAASPTVRSRSRDRFRSTCGGGGSLRAAGPIRSARALTASAGTSRYPQDTIRYKLVRLLDGPEAQECDRWLIAAEALDGNERVFRGVADAARDVGLPWMRKKTSLEALIYELRTETDPGDVRRT